MKTGFKHKDSMKYRFFIFLFTGFLAGLFPSCGQRGIPPEITSLHQEKKTYQHKRTETIIIDPGHGGKDSGAVSKRDNYEEKELTLQTAILVRNYLNQLGYTTILTRNQDVYVPLDTRADIANSLRADLFVSVHYNYSPNGEAKGIEVYYYKENTTTASNRVVQSKSLGSQVLKKVISQTGAESRGLKEGNFAVIRETLMPAILVEAGFLSNSQERDKIHDSQYQRRLAWGIAKGIDLFLSGY